MSLPRIAQSPRDPAFVQNPYPFYEAMRALGPLVVWEDYDLPALTGYAAINAVLRDRRFGRAVPATRRQPVSDVLTPWQTIEDISLLALDPPEHTRLRRQVLAGFTSRRLAGLEPEIAALAHALIDRFEGSQVDLLSTFAETLPVTIIARLIGVPEAQADLLLAWSHAMVAMYQARKDEGVERAAGQAAAEFTAFLTDVIAARRAAPQDDLISEMIAAGDLSEAEMIGLAVLLLNAGHEATVHTIGNGVKAILEAGIDPLAGPPDLLAEEILRFDAPLHMFTRFAREEVELLGHRFAPGDEIALLLGAANRDEDAFDGADEFWPDRAGSPHVSLGAGIHFCIGAPLARLELVTALPILFERCPNMTLADAPRYADRYHFHGLEALEVTVG